VPAGDVETGLADWQAIPIESIDRIEVLRGAASSLFGDTALGGVVQVFRKPRTQVSLSAGSFATSRWSASYADDLFSAGASGTRSDGFREHGDYQELFANAAFTRGGWRASLDFSNRDRNDAGALSAEEIEEDRFGSNELFGADRDETRRLRGSLQYRGAFDGTLYAHDRHTDFTGTLLLAPGFGDTATRELDTSSIGASAMKTLTLAHGRIAGGVDAARDAVRSVYGDTRGSGSRRRGAAFVTGEWRVSDAVRVAAGGRWDSIGDSFEDLDITDDAFSPRAAVSFETHGVTSYLQLSRAFKAPTLDQRFDQRPFPDFTGGSVTVSNPALVPQRSNNLEAGVRGGEGTLAWEVNGYVIHVEDEIDFDVRTLRYANIGSSRHRGAEGLLRFTPGNVFSGTVSYAWTRVGDHGLQFKNIAEHVARAGVDVRSLVDLHVDVEHSAGRYLDDANRFPLDDATVVDLRLSRAFGAVVASLDANNLFDRHYAPLGYTVTDFSTGNDVPYYYPAAGRSIALTLTWAPRHGGPP
jgi:vitamin B12 transporter